jgi:hypothetical protein
VYRHHPGGSGGGGTDAGTKPPSDAGSAPDSSAAKDAAPPIPPPPTTSGGTVACYTEGAPANTCALPADHCCFGNYSSAHDGYCAGTRCPWGTISCDGPEDCASGQVCCANRLIDPSDDTTMGYAIACQAGPCAQGTPELCHAGPTTAGTCQSSQAKCVSAFGVDNDLPSVLDVCTPF